MERILNASYGDAAQRAANRARPDPYKALDILQAHKEQKKGARDDAQDARNAYDAAKAKGYRPPYWNSRVHGKPMGDFNREAPKEVRVAKGGKDPAPAKPLEVREAPYQVDTRDLGPELSALEEAMRRCAIQRTKLHQKPQQVLHAALAKALRAHSVTQESKVTAEEFVAAWGGLGLRVPLRLAYGLFNRYGQDPKGRMPVTVFTEALLSGPARRLAMQDNVMEGPLLPGQDANHLGGIKYPQCKVVVHPPSDWDPRLAERSEKPPDLSLRLEFVHGYEGKSNTCGNVYYLATGEVVYHTAGVVVVYDRVKHRQRFFLGHDDDVSCVAVSPDRTLVASGQVTGTGGRDPRVIVWDPATLATVASLDGGLGLRSVLSVCFSPSGRRLAAVYSDNQHTLILWDIRTGKQLATSKTMHGTPPSAYGVVWSPFEDRILAYGVNFIKFWTLLRGNKGEGQPLTLSSPEAGSFGNAATQTVTSAAFLPSGVVLSGSPDGYILSWKKAKCVGRQSAHGIGPEVHRPDGRLARHGVRALVLRADRKTLLSGGADGVVKAWDVSSGDLGAALWKLPLLPEAAAGQVPPAIRALDCLPGSETFVAGSSRCEVWEVDKDPEPLIVGHEGTVYALAMHPKDPERYATASEAGRVMFWNARTCRLASVVEVRGRARSLAYHPSGHAIAVGLQDGGIQVLDVRQLPKATQVGWMKTFGSSVDELKFSPDGKFLAAGSHDTMIDIYAAEDGFKRVARCEGLSSTITHLDWSVDGRVIMANSQAYELVYFDAATGKQVKDNQRDTKWATYTGVLGFPVMGVWQPYSDGTDINAVDRSPSQEYVVTADDFGKVTVKCYPSVIKHAPGVSYGGHSSHVMNVRWAADESRVVSVGGRDRSVLQWTVLEPRPFKDRPKPQAPYALGDREAPAGPITLEDLARDRARRYEHYANRGGRKEGDGDAERPRGRGGAAGAAGGVGAGADAAPAAWGDQPRRLSPRRGVDDFDGDDERLAERVARMRLDLERAEAERRGGGVADVLGMGGPGDWERGDRIAHGAPRADPGAHRRRAGRDASPGHRGDAGREAERRRRGRMDRYDGHADADVARRQRRWMGDRRGPRDPALERRDAWRDPREWADWEAEYRARQWRGWAPDGRGNARGRGSPGRDRGDYREFFDNDSGVTYEGWGPGYGRDDYDVRFIDDGAEYGYGYEDGHGRAYRDDRGRLHPWPRDRDGWEGDGGYGPAHRGSPRRPIGRGSPARGPSPGRARRSPGRRDVPDVLEAWEGPGEEQRMRMAAWARDGGHGDAGGAWGDFPAPEFRYADAGGYRDERRGDVAEARRGRGLEGQGVAAVLNMGVPRVAPTVARDPGVGAGQAQARVQGQAVRHPGAFPGAAPLAVGSAGVVATQAAPGPSAPAPAVTVGGGVAGQAGPTAAPAAAAAGGAPAGAYPVFLAMPGAVGGVGQAGMPAYVQVYPSGPGAQGAVGPVFVQAPAPAPAQPAPAPAAPAVAVGPSTNAAAGAVPVAPSAPQAAPAAAVAATPATGPPPTDPTLGAAQGRLSATPTAAFQGTRYRFRAAEAARSTRPW